MSPPSCRLRRQHDVNACWVTIDRICDTGAHAHATGFLGRNGRGTHEYRGVMGRIDIITGTLGKALGGASGGFTSARKRIVEHGTQTRIGFYAAQPPAGAAVQVWIGDL